MLTGRTHQPMFTMIRIEGKAVAGPDKTYRSGPYVRAQRINGVATQEDIVLPITALLGGFGQPSVQKLVVGRSYQLQGCEMGGYVGVPPDVGVPIVYQIPYSGLDLWFAATTAERVDPVPFRPADYVNRQALIQGTAVNVNGNAFIVGGGWRIQLEGTPAWPADWLCKEVEALGIVRRGAGSNASAERVQAAPSIRLVRLEDQVGRKVELRGTAWSHNGVWWFDYRGQKVYVDAMDRLPGWTFDNHGKPMIIRGTLIRAKRPDLDDTGPRAMQTEKDCFVIPDASWQSIDHLLAPECVDPK